MGSVKELKAYRQPTPARSGIGQFVFSDRYSVFDWGEMPDRIEGKGASLCVMAAHFFEILGREGIPNHFLGLGDGYDIKLLTGLMEPSTRMMVKLFRVVRPGTAEGSYDYSAYRSLSSNFLIPLEVIYRNVLPAGSSVFRRLEEGTLSAADLGLSGPPEPGQVLERPFIEVSTKLESTDRYISWDEARSISCLTIDETDRIRELTLRINEIISAEAARAGLVNEDGKIEFAFDESGDIVVVDVIGTPDECRFTLDGFHVCKELARTWYRDTPWHIEIEAVKKAHPVEWKSFVSAAPDPLPPERLRGLSLLYKACCNALTGKSWFRAPDLGEVAALLGGRPAVRT